MRGSLLFCLGLALVLCVACSKSVAPGDGGTAPVDGVGIDTGPADVSTAESQDGGCVGATDGTACDDGDPCTLEDACQEGQCVGGVNNPCATDDPCKVGSCDPETGACATTSLPDGETCSVACFSSATCQAGACAVDPDSALSCEAELATLQGENACVVDLKCAAETGACTEVITAVAGSSCDSDSDLCSIETCDDAGVCQGAGAVDCSAQGTADPCNQYTCDKKSGDCKVTGFVGPVSCDDGSACTQSDTCAIDAFNFVSCQGTPLDVDDGNACTDDSCDGATGEITHTPNVGASCPAKTGCSDTWVCDAAGLCAPGAPNASCNDGLTCTAESCDAATGDCVHDVTAGSCLIGGACYADGEVDPANVCQVCTADANAKAWSSSPTGAPCVDADLCTPNDTCDGAGTCKSGPAKGCEETACSQGVCDPATGVCAITVDKSACLIAGTCIDAQAPHPENLCVACDPTLSQETWSPVAVDTSCADGDLCNGDEACDGAGSCLAGVALDCDDGNDCTQDSCDPDTGACVYTPQAGCPVLEVSPTEKDLRAVWGGSEDAVWAVGEDLTIIFYNGEKWLSYAIPNPGCSKLQLYDVHGVAGDHIWAGASDERLIHYDGTAWHCKDPKGLPYKVWNNANDVPIYKVWSGLTDTEDGVVATSLGFTFHWKGPAVGAHIWKWANETWDNSLDMAAGWNNSGMKERPVAICHEKEIWLATWGLAAPKEASDAAQLRLYQAAKPAKTMTTLQDLADPYFEMRDGVCLASNDVHMAGYYGQVVHWDGAKLTKTNLYPGVPVEDRPTFWAVAGDAVTGVFAVGDQGAIAHWQPEVGWKLLESGVDVKLNGVWVGAEGTVWVVGDGGTILKIVQGAP